MRCPYKIIDCPKVDTSGMDKISCLECEHREISPLATVHIITACSPRHLQYLEGCIESVRNLPIEVNHIVEIDWEERGSAHIINRAFKQVKPYDWVALLDADDFLLPDWVTLLRYTSKYDVIYSKRYASTRLGFWEEGFENVIPGGCTLVRGSILTEWPDVRHGQDAIFWAKIRKKHKTIITLVDTPQVRDLYGCMLRIETL